MTEALYRRYVRETLAIAEPFAMTEQAMLDAVDELVPGDVDVSMFRAALRWNLSRDYVQSAKNDDTDDLEWRLTRLGRAKQEQP